MKLEVVFREYELPYIDPHTEEQHRGDFLGSFKEVIEGETPADIIEIAGMIADGYSEKRDTDVRVWETVVVVTPRGIQSL